MKEREAAGDRWRSGMLQPLVECVDLLQKKIEEPVREKRRVEEKGI
jgi:hypothetical protein